MNKSPSVAFFDFDKTLIAKNSANLWVKSELDGGYITYWQAAKGVYHLARYHLGTVDMDAAFRESLSVVAGTPEVAMRTRVRHFYDTQLRNLYRPGALRALARHRQLGDRLVLLTTATNYLAECVMEHMQLDDILCTTLEVDDAGVFTGKAILPLSFGDGKRQLAESLANKLGHSLKDCTFYTDSTSDLPALESVGYPVVVNPDPTLRKIATKKGWVTVDWGTPEIYSESAA